ncbi:serine protease [Sanguibacteroides justesenii]|uniref:Serine protease n=2 Tax=Porphyromonadaceae TaxID=171551 RepID=A0A0C3RG12_9PORP|nr:MULTISPECIES: NfeD family protein [Sanguibacteroides]KIO43642.1 serine protease [Sanguibacteroides justesenii]KIO45806.1 serine protease [Sanguibacteroides justesenii]PXZ45413.1 serine protease [Sanguibacteroides justesenii]
MRKFVLIIGLLCWFFSGMAEEKKSIIFKVDIKDEIGPGVWRLVKRSYEEADKANADYMLIHMNTYGGMVVYADSLRSLILNDKRPSWVFIDNNAASAGALISLACDRIYMREGANIGAATVVNQTGEAMPDKYQSYMRSMIRSTAQAHGMDTIVNGGDTVVRWKRDPRIAEAMVDERIAIKGVTDSGKIVTFTPHEAIKFGFCDGIAENVSEVVRSEGISDYEIKEYHATGMDKLIGFLIHPIVQGILIMIIIGGIYFELQTPGVGFPLVAALAACVLYFAPLYLEGFANNIELIMFVVGVILLLTEIFVIPGFGVAGISGIVCIIASLVLAGIDDVSFDFFHDFIRAIIRSIFFVISCSLISLFGSIWLSRKLFASRRLGWSLQAEETTDSGFVGVDMTAKQELGKEGIAETDLRPAGKVSVDGEQYDAVSNLGMYIPKGNRVKVVKYQAGQLYVESVKE